jgi:putative transposase
VLSVHANHWYVSFNYDDEPKTANHTPKKPPSIADIAAMLSQVDEATLTAMAAGIDRGVVQPFTLSTGEVFDFSDAQKASLVKAERKARAWQRKAARRVKGSNNQRKAYRQVAKARAKQAAIREDFAHKTSLALASLQDIFVIAFEDLAIPSMTKRAKKKLNKAGVALRNNAKAKSGLAKAILSKAWGKTKTYTTYKALKRGKLVVAIPAAYTSQQCHHCGHIHKENRLSQSEFLCQRCGHQSNADINAALNIRDRGVQKVQTDNWVKEVKSCSLKKKRVGQELSERVARLTPVEKVLDVGGIALPTQFSRKQEESHSSAKAG